jgi:hypothetical protein
MKRSFAIWAMPCLALLYSCHKADPWTYSQIQSGSPSFSSARLTYRSPDIVNGIDLQFLATETTCHLYLEVHSHPLREYKNNPENVLITISCEGKKRNFIAARHQGGQRALVSEEAQKHLIKCLENGHMATLSTSGYSTIISPESFSKKFPLLQTPPRFKSPFYSPLS